MVKWTDKAARSKIGGLFFKPEEDVEVRVQEPVPNLQARPEPVNFGSSAVVGIGQVPPVSQNPSLSMPSNVDLETRVKIQAIADGVDQVSFTKFIEVKKNMSSGFGSDEAGLYRSTLVAGKAFGIPTSEVLRGADAIINELSQAEQKFRQAAPQRLAAKVGARREKIAQIRQTISIRQGELKHLQEKINRINAEIVQLSQAEQGEQAAISRDEQGIREDAERFTAALEAVRAPYVAERQKIELYGKGA